MAKAIKSSEDALSIVIDQLAVMNKRFDVLEEKYEKSIMIKPLSVKEESEIQDSSPKMPLSFQHGIRAIGLWKEKNFTLSREPLKYGFKLEKASEYSIWSFSTLKC